MWSYAEEVSVRQRNNSEMNDYCEFVVVCCLLCTLVESDTAVARRPLVLVPAPATLWTAAAHTSSSTDSWPGRVRVALPSVEGPWRLQQPPACYRPAATTPARPRVQGRPRRPGRRCGTKTAPDARDVTDPWRPSPWRERWGCWTGGAPVVPGDSTPTPRWAPRPGGSRTNPARRGSPGLAGRRGQRHAVRSGTGTPARILNEFYNQ